jgi:iron complex outermembrane recepter protein
MSKLNLRVLNIAAVSSVSIVALVIGCGGAVLAQQPSGTVQTNSTELEPIIVKSGRTNSTVGQPPETYAGGQVATGGRVGFLGDRTVYDTPFTQNSYTEQLARDQQASSILNVLDNSPGVRAIASPFSPQPNVSIRGFEVNSREFAFDGLYGIASPFRHSVEGAERIEVLNGPAAFLFGFPPDGNVGGVVNIIPKRATAEPLTRVTTFYGSDSTVGASLDFGRRFGEGDEWGVRVNGSYRNGDTPIDPGNEQLDNGTIGLDYQGDRFRFSADLGYNHFDGEGLIQSYFVAPTVTEIPKAPSLRNSVQQSWEDFDTTHVYAASRAEFDLTDDITIFGAVGGSDTDSDLLSARPRLLDNAGTVTMTPNSYIEDAHQWTAEAGIRARFSTGPVDHEAAIVGTHYSRDRDYTFAFAPTSAFPSNLYDPVDGPRPTFPPVSSLPRTIETRDLDGIALTDTMSILDDRIQVMGGVRFQRARTTTTAATGITTRYDETASTPLVGVVVKPWENVSLYASYAEGFSFGPTAPIGAVNQGTTFAPVITKQTEAGVKFDFGTMGATFALFEVKRPSSFTDPSTLIFGVDGEQRNRGVELNVFGEPVSGLRLLGGITLVDGELTKTAGGTFDGNVAPATPRTQISFGGEFDLPESMVSGVTLSGRVVYTGKQYLDQANNLSIPDFTRLDLGARYKFDVHGKPVTARLNVLNVTGEDYWASTGQGVLSLGTPRTVLLSLSADL